MCNYKRREGSTQISADTNFSIYLSGSSTFLPQSGPDVMGQAGSYSETVKPVFAHNIGTSLYYHLDADTTYNRDVVRESFKVELSLRVKYCL